MELHGRLGPANTTVTDVAKLAGVSRMTVYNHFPTERDLFLACSTHWAERNPFPDPSRWAGIDDPSERLASALDEMYGWYEAKEDMLRKVFGDLHSVPALEDVMVGLWGTYLEELLDVLARGWPAPGPESTPLRPALRVALDFGTWRTLTASGLGSRRAARLTARMVTGASRAAVQDHAGRVRGHDRRENGT